MKVQGHSNAKWEDEESPSCTANKDKFDIDNNMKTDNWCSRVDWDKVASYINYSGHYQKSAPLTSRSLSYHQSINNIVEQIMTREKFRWKTPTEVLRVALHVGMQVLYHNFITTTIGRDNSRGYFFFLEMQKAHRLQERANMISLLDSKMQELMEEVNKGVLPKADAIQQFRDLYLALPDPDKPFAKAAIMDEAEADRKNNITYIRQGIRSSFKEAVEE